MCYVISYVLFAAYSSAAWFFLHILKFDEPATAEDTNKKDIAGKIALQFIEEHPMLNIIFVTVLISTLVLGIIGAIYYYKTSKEINVIDIPPSNNKATKVTSAGDNMKAKQD
eukprot:TRINITY_DN7542_c0_g1_i2.p1 TRINITY_DN7542_c0_g1~~TRINITY_DN7542_c0_g1_i2.p1  ORF type:complete len:112 (-),score=18.14 TRINITY_DN7542_c0_g1_i2:205-540(-)